MNNAYLEYPTSGEVRGWYDNNPTVRVYVKRSMAKALREQDEVYRMNVETIWSPAH